MLYEKEFISVKKKKGNIGNMWTAIMYLSKYGKKFAHGEYDTI